MMTSSPSPTRGSPDVQGHRRIIMGGCVLFSAALLALMMFLFVTGYLRWSRAAEKRLDEQLTELRAQGQPMTPAELDASHKYPPEKEDVTALILAAIRELDTPGFRAAADGLPIVGTAEEEVPPPGQPWQSRGAARKLLNQYSEPLQQLHEAADKGAAARFPVNFEAGVGMLLEHTQRIRAAARLLALEAHVRAHEDDAQGAARSISTLLSLARSLEKEPMIISQLVRYSCLELAYGLIDDLLPHVEFADEDFVMWQRQLRRIEVAEGVQRALVGERMVGIDTIHGGRLGDAEESAASTRLGTHEDFSLYLEMMSRYVEAAGQPWPEALELAAQVDQELQATAGASRVKQMRYMMSNMLLPAVETVFTAGARTEAGRRVIDTAIAVERYQRKDDQPPQTIEALVPTYLPAVPSDPFDGQPLRYILSDDEVIIYSIGRDRADDGGRGDTTGEPDLVVRLPRE